MAENSEYLNSFLVSLIQSDKNKAEKVPWKSRVLVSPLVSGLSMGLDSFLEQVDTSKLALVKKFLYVALKAATFLM